MTNRECLLEQMQNMSDEELAMELPLDCERFEFKKPECDGDCKKCKTNWLKAEHKEPIKLSDAERVILENIDKDYKWIFRFKDRTLLVSKNKPFKSFSNMWAYSGEAKDLDVFKNLFKFIKWEDTEPYNIEELLKGE